MIMEQIAACVMNTRSGSLCLRVCGGSGSFLRSCSPSVASGRTAWRFLKSARFPISFDSEGYGCSTGADFQSSAEVIKCGQALGNLHSLASIQGGGRGGKDIPVGSCNDHSLWASGRLDARVGVDSRGRGRLDRQAASAAGLSNAVALVNQARRKSNSMVLTPEDSLRHHSSSFERTEPIIASQESLVLPQKASSGSRQLCVAVDVDEVLGSFLATLNLFIKETYSLHHELSEYYIYDFMKVWNCSQMEANLRVHAFFESDHFKNGISPIPGAHKTLLQLASYCQLVVVTSRQHVIRERTLEWIDRYYAGIFKEVHFGNHYALEGISKPKSEICRSLGAHVLIDDNPRYAMDCAESGIEVLLFDLHGGYPWSKTPCGPQHPLITRVKDWQEVEQALLARTCAELVETNVEIFIGSIPETKNLVLSAASLQQLHSPPVSIETSAPI